MTKAAFMKHPSRVLLLFPERIHLHANQQNGTLPFYAYGASVLCPSNSAPSNTFCSTSPISPCPFSNRHSLVLMWIVINVFSLFLQQRVADSSPRIPLAYFYRLAFVGWIPRFKYHGGLQRNPLVYGFDCSRKPRSDVILWYHRIFSIRQYQRTWNRFPI